MTQFTWDGLIASFTSLFVVMNLVGIIPIFVMLADGRTEPQRRLAINLSCLTILVVTGLFVVLGKILLKLIGVTMSDFALASGIMLLAFAIISFVGRQASLESSGENIGVVPLGTPLLAGPGVLTTALTLSDANGYLVVFLALALNVAAVWLAFSFSTALLRALGTEGMKALSKISSVLLAGIGVVLIRKGAMSFLSSNIS